LCRLERLILSTEVEMVVVPGTEGNFGVLPGTRAADLDDPPGTIDIYQGGAVIERIFVVSGIAEVTPQRCNRLGRRGDGARFARPRRDRSRIADRRGQSGEPARAISAGPPAPNAIGSRPSCGSSNAR